MNLYDIGVNFACFNIMEARSEGNYGVGGFEQLCFFALIVVGVSYGLVRAALIVCS